MTPEIAYSLAWAALAALMIWLNLHAGSGFFKGTSAAGIIGFTVMAVLTLLGIVGVPA